MQSSALVFVHYLERHFNLLLIHSQNKTQPTDQNLAEQKVERLLSDLGPIKTIFAVSSLPELHSLLSRVPI